MACRGGIKTIQEAPGQDRERRNSAKKGNKRGKDEREREKEEEEDDSPWAASNTRKSSVTRCGTILKLLKIKLDFPI